MKREKHSYCRVGNNLCIRDSAGRKTTVNLNLVHAILTAAGSIEFDFIYYHAVEDALNATGVPNTKTKIYKALGWLVDTGIMTKPHRNCWSLEYGRTYAELEGMLRAE
jgi:hypothetical protein